MATIVLKNPIGNIKTVKVAVTSLQRAFSAGERVKDSHGNNLTVKDHSPFGLYAQDDKEDTVFTRPDASGLQRHKINPGYE